MSSISPLTEKVLLKHVLSGEAPVSLKNVADRFPRLDTLGSGSFGEVWIALDLSRYQTVVILKRMSKEITTKLSAQIEVQALKLVLPVCEKSSICYDGFFEDENNFYITTKTQGTETKSLWDFMDHDLKRKNNPSLWPTLTKLIQNMIQCVQDFFSVGIAHRDIKPGNLIVSEDLNVRSIDFGNACWFLEDEGQCKGRFHPGTYSYLAPEILLLRTPGARHNRSNIAKLNALTLQDYWRADIYALGISIYEVLFGQTPTEKHHPKWYQNGGSLLSAPRSELVAFYNQWSISSDLTPEMKAELGKVGLTPAYLDKFVKRNPNLRTPFPLPTDSQIVKNLNVINEEEEVYQDLEIPLTVSELFSEAHEINEKKMEKMIRYKMMKEKEEEESRSIWEKSWTLLRIDQIFALLRSEEKLIPTEETLNSFAEKYSELYPITVKETVLSLNQLGVLMDLLNKSWEKLHSGDTSSKLHFRMAKVYFEKIFKVRADDAITFKQLFTKLMKSRPGTTKLTFYEQLQHWYSSIEKSQAWVDRWLSHLRRFGAKKTICIFFRANGLLLRPNKTELDWFQKQTSDEQLFWLFTNYTYTMLTKPEITDQEAIQQCESDAQDEEYANYSHEAEDD